MLELRPGLGRRATSDDWPWCRPLKLGTLMVRRNTRIDIQRQDQEECVLQIFSDLSVPMTSGAGHHR